MRTFSRRSWLKTLAAGTALAPFLDFEAPAHAALSGRAKRVVLFCTMGTQPSIWTPTSVKAENDFVLAESTAPLDAIRKHLVMIEGMPSQNPGENHASPGGLTGLGFGASGSPAMISVDQFVADKLIASGVNSPVPSLLLGAETSGGGGKTMFLRANNLPTIGSPLSAFKAVFGNMSAGSSTTTPDALLARRKSTLDAISGQIKTLQQNVGSEARARLDLHLSSIRQIENRLSGGSSGGGQLANCGTTITATDDTSDVLKADLVHLDILVSALACNATRVAAIQFGSDQVLQVNLPDVKLAGNTTLQGDEHGLMIHSGSGDNYASLTKFESWLAQRYVDLVNRLEATPDPDGGGSMLDSTLVVWARDMGDAVSHNQESMRFVFAGSKYLKTDPNGRYINFGGKARHERALLNICEAMGVTDFTGFGDKALADKTPLSELKAV